MCSATLGAWVGERRPGMCSESTRTPPGRTERRITTPPSCSAVSSLPGAPAGPSGRSRGTSGLRLGRLGRLGRRGLAACRLGGLGLGLLGHSVQRQLAAGGDLADLDLDLLADREDVLDVLDAPATD